MKPRFQLLGTGEVGEALVNVLVTMADAPFRSLSDDDQRRINSAVNDICAIVFQASLRFPPSDERTGDER